MKKFLSYCLKHILILKIIMCVSIILILFTPYIFIESDTMIFKQVPISLWQTITKNRIDLGGHQLFTPNSHGECPNHYPFSCITFTFFLISLILIIISIFRKRTEFFSCIINIISILIFTYFSFYSYKAFKLYVVFHHGNVYPNFAFYLAIISFAINVIWLIILIQTKKQKNIDG